MDHWPLLIVEISRRELYLFALFPLLLIMIFYWFRQKFAIPNNGGIYLYSYTVEVTRTDVYNLTQVYNKTFPSPYPFTPIAIFLIFIISKYYIFFWFWSDMRTCYRTITKASSCPAHVATSIRIVFMRPTLISSLRVPSAVFLPRTSLHVCNCIFLFNISAMAHHYRILFTNYKILIYETVYIFRYIAPAYNTIKGGARLQLGGDTIPWTQRFMCSFNNDIL